MTHLLFEEINKFDQWAKSLYTIPQDDVGGEWECNYHRWANIYSAFKDLISSSIPTQWSYMEKERLLYIIARDNEMRQLAGSLTENALVVLAEYAIGHGHRDDKWQIAVQLHKLSDKQLATNLLEAFVNDEEEYASRRALMEFAKVQPNKIERYAELFWNRNKYGDMGEYQRMAVLHALHTIRSKRLSNYIKLAKQDGRRYLIESANKLEGE